MTITQTNPYAADLKLRSLEGHFEILRSLLPSREVFDLEYANVLRPAIFTNVVNQWPALEKWSIDWFKEVHGDKDVYGDLLKNRMLKNAYLTNVNIIDLIPELAADIRFPHFHSYDRLTALSTWIGTGGAKVHCDFANNLFAQIQGTKIFHLYSPTSLLAKYPCNDSWRSCFSEIDFENFKPRAKDIESFSELKPDYSFEIKPGEMLFLPYGWWHRVLTPEPTISINQWWLTPGMVARIPVNYLRRTLRRALQAKD